MNYKFIQELVRNNLISFRYLEAKRSFDNVNHFTSIFSECTLHIFISSDCSYLYIFQLLQEMFRIEVGNQDELDSFDPREIIHRTHHAFLFLIWGKPKFIATLIAQIQNLWKNICFSSGVY